jgi:subtilisin family serine protease
VFPGEYVVTLPAQEALVSGSVGALGVTPRVENYGTVLRGLNDRTVLLGSSWRPSSPAVMGTVSSLSATLRAEDLFCKTLLARKVVTSCTPNYELRASDVAVTDPHSDNLWGLNNDTGISARRAWDVSTGSSDVVVAIIDTGIDYTHPDLAANMWVNPGETPGNGIDDDANGYIDDIHGVNTVLGAAERGNPMDDNEHGTHVAGTIGAVGNNGEGVVGVNHTVKLMGLKFMDASGGGRLSDAIAAIDYMVSMKATYGINIRVSNNSWGGGGFSPALHAAIDRARAAGIAFVAAAGNSAQDTDLFPSYPSSYEVANVVSVAAINTDQTLASFSNYGAESVDIAAPGVGIFSTLPNGRYGYLSGTSMATPHVVGALALLFAVDPSLTLEQAIERLYETGRSTTSLVKANGDVVVRTRRVVDVGRRVLNQREPLPPVDDGLPACGYDFQTRNLALGGSIDTSADAKAIVNQNDEGGYYRVSLPFEFPFFRRKSSTLFVSPNGVVYFQEPTTSDYQTAQRAPNNSIAAFHSDLIPRAAKQGVRVAVHSDRVAIAWSSEHYALLGNGPVTVRLTLFKSGVISDSISFDSTTNPAQMARFLLGNPFSTPTGSGDLESTFEHARSRRDPDAAR